MKERDWSDQPKELERMAATELFNAATHEVAQNRKARRDVMRKRGCFRKPKQRIKRGDTDA